MKPENLGDSGHVNDGADCYTGVTVGSAASSAAPGNPTAGIYEMEMRARTTSAPRGCAAESTCANVFRVNLLPQIFLQRVRDSADRDAFGQRGVGGWNWASWGETGERAARGA